MAAESTSIFGTETLRLLRERWPNATELAEELFAILKGEIPINIPVGSTVGAPQSPEQALLNFKGVTPGTTIFNFQGHQGQDFGSFAFNVDGSLSFFNSQGQPQTGGKPPQQGGAGGGGMPGVVLSGGPGQIYSVRIYPNGLSGGTLNVSVTQLQIDPAETIPPGTWATVTQTADGTYQMQVPVWL